MFVVGGESLIDLVSEPRKGGGAIHLVAHAGGSPFNCAVALARLENKTGFLCPISKDGFGTYLLEPLVAAGVKPLLQQRVSEPSTLAVVTLNERGEAAYEFYRGAERALDEAKLLAALPDKMDLYQIGGFCPIKERDAKIWLSVVRAAIGRGALIAIDPNIRPSLIEDFEAYRQRLFSFLDLAHLIKLSVEDLEALDGAMDINAHAEELLARPNCELVVVTDGENGSFAFTQNGRARTGIYKSPVFGDTVGAGDSLMAGILSFLNSHQRLGPEQPGKLGQPELEEMLRYGAIVAGLNCAQKGCNPPTRAEVDAVLELSARRKN